MFLKVDSYKYDTEHFLLYFNTIFNIQSTIFFFKVFEDLKQNFYRLLANSTV